MPPLDPEVVQDVVRRALEEDVGPGDVTTRATVPPGTRARARITQKAPGVVFGLEAAEPAFAALDPDVTLERRCAEGDWRDGGPVLDIEGAAAAMLTAERTALNLLGRLSGVATMTARYVDAVDGHRRADPRHAQDDAGPAGAREGRGRGGRRREPPLRPLRRDPHQGEPRRHGRRRRRGGPGGARIAPELAVEVECRTPEEVDEALEAGAPRVLLDNMEPAALRAIVARVDGRAALEASGGVTLDTVREIAGTGVDFVSVGALTHSAPALDLSLLLEPLS